MRVKVYIGIGNIDRSVDLDRRLQPCVATEFRNLTGIKTLRHIGAIADDSSQFATAIRQLLGDTELRKHLGEAGRSWYLKHFTWQAAWKRLEEYDVL